MNLERPLASQEGQSISFPAKEGETAYYTLAQLSELAGYHPVYLRRLLIDGKIKGIKVQLGAGSGFWVTTIAEVENYQKQKDNRGRRPKHPPKRRDIITGNESN